jgi:hypothetical protein
MHCLGGEQFSSQTSYASGNLLRVESTRYVCNVKPNFPKTFWLTIQSNYWLTVQSRDLRDKSAAKAAEGYAGVA